MRAAARTQGLGRRRLVGEPKPRPNCPPAAAEPELGVLGSVGLYLRGRLFSTVFLGELEVADALVAAAALLNLFTTHVEGPDNLALANEVVRSAGKAPVSDRGAERDVAVDGLERPGGRPQGRNYFTSAPAAAAMCGGAVALGNVEYAVFKMLRDEFDQLGPQNGLPHAAAVSSRVSWCALIA